MIRQQSLKRRFLWVTLVVLCLLPLWSCQPQAGTYESGTQAGLDSKKIKAPPFKITDLEGKPLSLEALKGKVVLLDFWATWCVPCLISAPEVEKISEEYKGKDVAVLSISVDESESLVRQFVKRMGLTSRVAVAGQSQVDVQYGVSSIPTFFLIDKEGFVVSIWRGYQPGLAKTWRKLIDYLLSRS